MIPCGVHNSVFAQGGHRFCAGVHKSLEFCFEADFLGPLAVGIQAFNAIHRDVTCTTIEALTTDLCL